MYSLILSFLTFSYLAVLISSEKLQPCSKDQLYKIEYYHKTDKDIYVKLNTTLRCICDVKYKESRPKNYTQDNKNSERYFLKIKCSKDPATELVNQSICKEDEVCQHDIWKEYGEDYPGKTYNDYSYPGCKCDGSRRCMIERELYLHTKYTCKTLYKDPQINFCEKNSVAKVEYFRTKKWSKNQDTLKKINTLFICRCVIFHNYIALEGIQDPKDRRNVIVDYKCQNKFYTEYENLKSCSTGELCGIDHLNEYGSKRPGEKYLDYISRKCLCDRFRECVPKERTHEGNQNYYCELKKTDLSKLPTCANGDVYKEELLFGIFKASVPEDLIKMDTQLSCQCHSETMESSMLEEKLYPGRNTIIRKYECIQKRTIKIKYCIGHQTCVGNDDTEKKMHNNCSEYQVCRRDFIHDYGKDREGQQYGETVEKFCNCQDGLKCIPGSRVSLHSPAVKFDGVITYRCLKTEPEKLEPCAQNQTYKVEISRLVGNDSSKSIKLNTFIKCNCDSNSRLMPGEMVTRNESLYPYIESITTYSCPRLQSKYRRNCRDYGICRKGFRDNAGLEDPEKVITHYYTTYCKCCPELPCENAGEEGNTTIYRCIKKKSSSELKVCKDDKEVFQINIDLYWYESEVEPNHERSVIKTRRLNTFQECICPNKYADTNKGIDEIDIKEKGEYWFAVEDHHNQVIRRFICPKLQYQKEVILPYCTHKQICKTRYFENVGTEKPDLIIEVNNFTENCICRDPGTCQVTNRSSYKVVSQCIVDNAKKLHHLRRCIPGQVYMEEIHHSIPTENGEFRVIKNHTIHKCMCEQTLYNTELVGNVTISNHSTDAQTWIHSFYCPRHVSAVEEVQSCRDYAVCRIDIFTHYGEHFGPEAKYLKKSYPYCACDRDRICTISEKDYPKGASTTNDTYRCIEKNEGKELSPCSENQEFLVVVSRLGTNKSTDVKLNTFFKCTCDHDEVSYESLEHRSELDPSVQDQLLKTYKCPPRRIRPVEDRYCNHTDDVCFKVLHDYYGRERTGEFSFHSKQLCKCISPQECIPDTRRDNITSYRCDTKVCEDNEVCRILEYSEYTTNRKLQSNETLCHCNGVCSYRPVASIILSHTYNNATVYYDCKMSEREMERAHSLI